MKVKKIKGKKEILLNRSNRSRAGSNNESTSAQKSSHEIEVRQMGSTLHVVVMSEQDRNFTSSEIIHAVHEEGAEVVNANFSVTGDTVTHTIHANVGEFVPHFLAERVSNKLKKLIYGSKSDEESEEQFRGFEIEQDIWDQLQIQKVLPMEFNPSYFSVFDSIYG